MTAAADSFRRHGGRLAAARVAFPNAPEPWLDLSTGVNPFGWRAAFPSHETLRRLPDPESLLELEAVAATAFGAPPERVVATAGADAALRLLPLLTGAHSVAIASPTYGGHAQVWRAARAKVAETANFADDAEALVVVNPNNPDGAVHDAIALANGRRWLIVDESFVETLPHVSVAGRGLPKTVVLRSFGKFYGLPGLRLGFLVAEEAVARRARDLIGDWPVSAEAIAIGRAAYADAAWAESMRALLAEAARDLDGLLVRAGFSIVGGTTLFRLVRAQDAPRRFTALATRGVLTRPFAHDETLLRFGLPSGEERGRLAAALKTL